MFKEIKKIRFINSEILDKLVQSFIPLDKQVQLTEEQLEELIDVIENETILKKAKEIQEKKSK